MRGFYIYWLVPFLLVGTGIPTQARATGCETPSPNLQLSHDVWAAVPAHPLSRQTRAKVFGLLARLEGDWAGTGSTTACDAGGMPTAPARTPQQLRLSVTRNGASAYRFDFSVFDTKNKVRTTHWFAILPLRQALQVEGEGHLAITALSNHGVSVRTQTAMRTGFRSGFGAGTSHTVLSLETVRRLSLQGDKLRFSKSVFHNGAMIEFSHWLLSRN